MISSLCINWFVAAETEQFTGPHVIMLTLLLASALCGAKGNHSQHSPQFIH